MIFMKAQPGARFTGANGMIYTADADGLISDVQTHDVTGLREQGAGHATVPHYQHLKIAASHALYFEGATHKADANGILRNVPRDHAAALIEGGAAREATEAELAEPLPEATVTAATTEDIVEAVIDMLPGVEMPEAPPSEEPSAGPDTVLTEPVVIPEDEIDETIPVDTLAE